MAALFGTAPVAGRPGRRLHDLPRAVLLRPPIEQRLYDLTDLGGIIDITDRQHAGNQQRVDVLFAQIDADQVVLLLTAAHGDGPPGRLRGCFRFRGSRKLRPRRLLGRLLHPQRLLQTLGRAAQTLQAFARRRAQVFRLVEGLLQAPDLSPHQRELAAQAGNDLGAQAPLVISNVNDTIFALTHGSILRPLVARHRRSPTLPLLPLRTIVVAAALLAIAERALCHRPRLTLRPAHSSLRQPRSMRRASRGLSDWRHKAIPGSDNSQALLPDEGPQQNAISRTGSRGDRGRRSG